jgi:hypothetical protein
MKNSNDTIGNRTRDLLARSIVLQPNAPPYCVCVCVCVCVRVCIYIYIYTHTHTHTHTHKCISINSGGGKPHLIAINDNRHNESSNVFRLLVTAE